MTEKPRAVRVLLASLAFCIDKAKLLSQLMLLPLIALLAIRGYADNSTTDGITALLLLPEFAIYTLLAVNVHRLVLIGDDAVAEWGLSGWGLRETRYHAMLMGLMVVCLSLVLPSLPMTPIGPMVTVLISVLLAARIALIFPAIAIDTQFKLSDGWQLSSGHTRILVELAVLLPVLLSIPPWGVLALGGAFWMPPLLEIPANAFTIVAVSLIYSEIMKAEKISDSTDP